MINKNLKSHWYSNWNLYIFEALGSFFIVFAIQLAHTLEYGIFAIALSFFLSVFIAANISGAHLNSAVTLCIFLNDIKKDHANIQVEKYYGYVIFQILGGTLAGLLAMNLIGEDKIVDLQLNNTTKLAAFVYEMFYTGLLCFLVSILCDKNYPKTEPALIGLLVAGVIFVQGNAIGSWTGGIVNPSIGISLFLARSLGKAGFANFNKVGLYIVAPCVGSFFAHVLYDRFVRPFFDNKDEKIERLRESLLQNADREMIQQKDLIKKRLLK